MKERFEETGSLASVDVLAAIAALGRDAGSGTLRATGPGGHSVRFGFDTGVLVALDPPPESGPADVLIRAGKVQRPTYEALTVGDFEDRFAVAAASGVISRREVNWGLKISAIESLVRLLSWSEGAYGFEEGEPSPTAPPIRLPVSQWILELFLRSNDRGFVVRRVGPADVPIARSEGFAGEFAALGLTADADAVVEGIDGRRTIDEIVKRSRSDEFATLKLLAALITLGLVRPIHEIPESAPAEPEEAAAPPDVPLSEEPGGIEFELEPPPELPTAPETEAEIDGSDEGDVPGSPAETPAAALFEIVAALSIEDPPVEKEEAAPIGAGTPDEAFAERLSGGPAEERIPEPPPAAGEARDVSVPLFALTAPEAEGAADAEIAHEAVVPDPSDAHRRLGGIRAAAVLAALAVAGVVVWTRLRTVPAPAAGPPTPARSNASAPPSAPARPEGKAAPEHDIVLSAPPPPSVPSRGATVPAPHRTGAAPPRAVPGGSASGARGVDRPAPSASGGARSSWDELARAGRQTFEHPGANRYAIQVELACEEPTLRKAFDADPSGRRIWLAPYSFRGRSCYRVLWGRYRDLASARAAKSGLPDIFSHGGNRPAVVALGPAR